MTMLTKSNTSVIADTALYRCVVRNTVGSEFFTGEMEATSAEEALAMIEGHISVAEKETKKWLTNKLSGMDEVEREEFKQDLVDTLKLHENMREKGYVEAELYKQLELPAVRVKVYYPGTGTCAFNLSRHIGFEELGLE